MRQALNYAVDKDAIIQIVTHGVGSPMTSYMSSATPLHVGDAPLYPVDVEKAKALMKEAGFESGFSTSLLVLAGNQDEVGIATALQQMWGAIGIKLELQQVDNATRTDQLSGGRLPDAHLAWTDDIADPNEITSYFAYSPNIQSLHSGYEDKTINDLFEKSGKESDKAKRADQYKQIQDIYMKAAPILFLYQSPYPVALRKNVKGFVQIPLGNNIFAGAYKENWLAACEPEILRIRNWTQGSATRDRPLAVTLAGRPDQRPGLDTARISSPRGNVSLNYLVIRLAQIVPTFFLIMVIVLRPGAPAAGRSRPAPCWASMRRTRRSTASTPSSASTARSRYSSCSFCAISSRAISGIRSSSRYR